MTADLIAAALALFVYVTDAQTAGVSEQWETGTAMQAQAAATGYATGDPWRVIKTEDTNE